MTGDLRRELRLLGLVAALLALYGAAVGTLAARFDQLRYLRLREMSELGVSLWTLTGLLVFVAYALDLLLRRRPASPLRTMAEDARAHLLRPDLVVARVTILVVMFGLVALFGPAKTMIAQVRGFPLDHALAAADRALFLGRDPWTLTHALFGTLWPTFVLQLAYALWFVLMTFAVIHLMLRPERSLEGRGQYLVAYILTWSLLGTLGAILFASAGPCYFERAFGDPRFAPLMLRLADLQIQFAAAGIPPKLLAIDLQDALWSGYVARAAEFGGGISAMPSMHVAQAVLMALAGAQLDRRLGVALWAFAGVIWVASIHLGWHYALDGLVALPMTLVVWRASGALVRRFVVAPPEPGFTIPSPLAP